MESWCPSQKEALKELEELAPGVPFLALGQTVFWDEPLKGMILQASRRFGSDRTFIAGVHDTDYFAKHPGQGHKKSGFALLPHNDTTTQNLWAAAAEFSVLFGGETVISREKLQAAGAKIGRIEKERPGWLDEVTEAWGWRGLVSLNPGQRTIAEEPLDPLFNELFAGLDWGVQETISHLAGPGAKAQHPAADKLKQIFCRHVDAEEGQNLSGFYQRLLPDFYSLAAGEELNIETTSTTQLLAFNPATADLPRFRLLGHFLNPATRQKAEASYDQTVQGTEMYTLDRFGVGALPFDVFIPGRGRGTLRLGTRGGLIMTPEPLGFSFKKAPETTKQLAEILEKRFGEGVVLIGKAVTLIGMLAAEHVFVFHEGASGYMPRSQRFHQLLASAGMDLTLHPIVRIHLKTWQALEDIQAWFKLPQPLQRPFGTEELSGQSFASRWSEVAAAQKKILASLAELKRPLALVQFLQNELGGQWNCLAKEYEAIHERLLSLKESLKAIQLRKKEVLSRIKALNLKIDSVQKERGVHWRAAIFELTPSADDLSHREKLIHEESRLREEVKISWDQWRGLQNEQDSLVSEDEVVRARARRSDIALEAELARTRLIREAVISTEGLCKAGRRPAFWWIPLVSPDGAWREAMARRTSFRVEKLI